MTRTVSLVTENQILNCDDVAALREAVLECASDLSNNIIRMAALVRRLDELGVEVAIENSMLPFVRLIAHGQLSPSLFMALLGDIPLLEKAMRLPIPMQEQIAENEPMKVLELDGDHRMVRPLDMTMRERRQVFNGKRLRTDAEQIGWLREQRDKEANKSQTVHAPDVTVDRKRKGIVAGGVFIALPELAGYVASLSR